MTSLNRDKFNLNYCKNPLRVAVIGLRDSEPPPPARVYNLQGELLRIIEPDEFDNKRDNAVQHQE